MTAEPRKGARTVVMIGLATFAAVQLVAAMLAANATGTVMIQTLAAEVGAGRAGVAWSSSPVPTPARRVAVGAGAGAAFAAALIVLGLLTRGITLAPGGSTSIATLLLGAAVSAAGGVRDELLFRGLPIAAFRGRVSMPVLLVILGACAVVGTGELGTPSMIASRFAFAIAFGLLWLWDRGAFVPCGAHALVAFATGPLVSGGAVDLRGASAVFTSPVGLVGSAGAAALALVAAGALAFTARARLR